MFRISPFSMQDFKIHAYMTIIGQTDKKNSFFHISRPNPFMSMQTTKVEEKLSSLPYFDQILTALVLISVSKKVELPFTLFVAGHAWPK